MNTSYKLICDQACPTLSTKTIGEDKRCKLFLLGSVPKEVDQSGLWNVHIKPNQWEKYFHGESIAKENMHDLHPVRIIIKSALWTSLVLI